MTKENIHHEMKFRDTYILIHFVFIYKGLKFGSIFFYID